MITSQNITQHELIGLDTEIVESSNPQIVGMQGTIIDETKSMFYLKTKDGIKMIQKSHNKWKFLLNDNPPVVSGLAISRRPQDRLGAKS